MKSKIVAAIAIALAVNAVDHNAWAATPKKAWFGLSFNVESSGFNFINPTIESLHINKTPVNSPAEKAGLVKGDLLLEAEGVQVKGLKADKLKLLVAKTVGQSLTLKLQHATGKVYTAVLVGISKPEQ